MVFSPGSSIWSWVVALSSIYSTNCLLESNLQAGTKRVTGGKTGEKERMGAKLTGGGRGKGSGRESKGIFLSKVCLCNTLMEQQFFSQQNLFLPCVTLYYSEADQCWSNIMTVLGEGIRSVFLRGFYHVSFNFKSIYTEHKSNMCVYILILENPALQKLYWPLKASYLLVSVKDIAVRKENLKKLWRERRNRTVSVQILECQKA